MYYSAASFLIFILLNIVLRVLLNNSLYRFQFTSNLVQYLLSSFVFFGFFALVLLYYLMDIFNHFNVSYLYNNTPTSLFTYHTLTYLIKPHFIGLDLISIYYFPFIYIFVTITLLSILFCLSYNINELYSFMFYCTIIIIAGYFLFFTDSIILFFLAYEMLLIPSFFILYNFAKTRKCVEAAYLMFF